MRLRSIGRDWGGSLYHSRLGTDKMMALAGQVDPRSEATDEGHLQFTVRFILLATAVVAVVLGIFANRFKGRLRFVAAMKSLNAEVIYDSVHEDIDGAWTQWLCRWL